jgi:Flp pilus assembly protein TadD
LQYGSKDELSSAYRAELSRLGDAALGELASTTAKSGNKREWNTLGIAYARFGRIKDAEAAFKAALRLDPAFTSPQVNLGNLAYMQKEYRKALSSWQAAAKSLENQGKGNSTTAQMILVNVSLAYNALSDFAGARSTFEKAAAIDPEKLRDFAYLAGVGAGSSAATTGRASEQKETVVFLADE